MLYPQNGDRIVTIDSVTSLHPMYLWLLEEVRVQLPLEVLTAVWQGFLQTGPC